jgi:acetate kinase
MREILRLEDGGDEAALLALRVYVHRLRGAIATMSAALGGIDVLAFTGGVGEGAAEVRRRVAGGLGFLGVGVDEKANRAARADAEITGVDAEVRTLVIGAREDLEIAAQVRSLLSTEG